MSKKSNSKNAKKEKNREKNPNIDELTKDYMDLDIEFEELFPNLAKEMELNKSKLSMKGIRWDTQKYKDSEDLSELRNPDVISFIRRCNLEEEAVEIIDYMLRKGEITGEYAQKLKEQLESQGLESFGTKKKPGYYEKKYRT